MLPQRGEPYKTPRPMMQIRDAFVRGFIWTFHSIGTGKAAKIKSVTMFKAYKDQQSLTGKYAGKIRFGE
jgi:hypothetical protein